MLVVVDATLAIAARLLACYLTCCPPRIETNAAAPPRLLALPQDVTVGMLYAFLSAGCETDLFWNPKTVGMDETIAAAGWFRGRVFNDTQLVQRFNEYPLLVFVTYPVYTKEQDTLRGLLDRWREPPFKQHYVLVVHHPEWLLKPYFARELMVARHRVHLATLAPNTASYLATDVLARPALKDLQLDTGGGRWISPLFPLNLSAPCAELAHPSHAATVELLASDLSTTVCIQVGASQCVWACARAWGAALRARVLVLQATAPVAG